MSATDEIADEVDRLFQAIDRALSRAQQDESDALARFQQYLWDEWRPIGAAVVACPSCRGVGWYSNAPDGWCKRCGGFGVVKQSTPPQEDKP